MINHLCFKVMIPLLNLIQNIKIICYNNNRNYKIAKDLYLIKINTLNLSQNIFKYNNNPKNNNIHNIIIINKI